MYIDLTAVLICLMTIINKNKDDKGYNEVHKHIHTMICTIERFCCNR